jgi:hypothetical protein
MASLHARGLLPALAACIALVAAVSAAGQTTTEPANTEPDVTESEPTERERQRALVDLRRYRRQVRILFAVMGRRTAPVPRTRTEFPGTYEFHVWLRRLWIYRARRARALAHQPPTSVRGAAFTATRQPGAIPTRPTMAGCRWISPSSAGTHRGS